MKTIILSTLLLVAGMFQTTFATDVQYKTTSFKVSGKCEMCKSRIESALKSNAGVQNANWNAKRQVVTVVYNPNSISANQLHQFVADAGFDTDKIKATKASYKALPDCCQYKDKNNCCIKCCEGNACAEDCCTAECASEKECTDLCCKAECCQ